MNIENIITVKFGILLVDPPSGKRPSPISGPRSCKGHLFSGGGVLPHTSSHHRTMSRVVHKDTHIFRVTI